jgi:hypothetical protein
MSSSPQINVLLAWTVLTRIYVYDGQIERGRRPRSAAGAVIFTPCCALVTTCSR